MDIYTANKLVQLRKKNNYSQEELAQHLNISRQAVSKWERAESSPDTDNLIALAKLYRVSLDELLEIDVKTFVCEDNNNSESERKIISLKKEESLSPDDEINQILSSRSVSIKEEIYPQPAVSQNDDGEIYPQFDNPSQSIKSNAVNSFNADNYKIPEQPNNNINNVINNSYNNNHNITVIPKKKKFSKLIDNVSNSKYNFKLLYLFPYYALAATMFFIGMSDFFDFPLGYTYVSEMSYLWFLTIPLYYTGVAALQKNNLNWFCYPVLAVILFLILVQITGSPASLIAFATIPFYYFFVAVKQDKNKK